MKIFTLNGSKAALNIFAGLCVFTLIYFGFIHNSGTVAVIGEQAETSYLAIVINGFGFGDGGDGTREFMYMNIPFTGAVVPGGTYSREEAQRLLANGNEVVIHMPMEAVNMRSVRLPEINIMDSHTKAEARAALLKAIDQIHGAVGISPYMGSRVMENRELVTTILSTAVEHGLYFVDAQPAGGAAPELAKDIGVNIFTPDILIDNTRDIRRIERNLRRAAEIAGRNGFAVAIGHVGPQGGRATAQAIQNMQDELTEKGIAFITVSELMGILK